MLKPPPINHPINQRSQRVNGAPRAGPASTARRGRAGAAAAGSGAAGAVSGAASGGGAGGDVRGETSGAGKGVSGVSMGVPKSNGFMIFNCESIQWCIGGYPMVSMGVWYIRVPFLLNERFPCFLAIDTIFRQSRVDNVDMLSN